MQNLRGCPSATRKITHSREEKLSFFKPTSSQEQNRLQLSEVTISTIWRLSSSLSGLILLTVSVPDSSLNETSLSFYAHIWNRVEIKGKMQPETSLLKTFAFGKNFF
ncbi:hypothetical protein AMECASPLE_021798 [Ameca splendens]|uniref:Uncharacterized protein n=1 Tax=Ameca splendens TaxID=208324 RepID=A0ABV0Z2A8_9TELE